MMTRVSLSPGSAHAPFKAHIPALDGVRGLAILLVLFYHLFSANNQTQSAVFDVITKWRSSAWIGVDLFFVLSGFLITGILYDSLSDQHYFKKFYVRRVLRIFPLYYGVLALLLVLSHPLHLVWHGFQWVLLTYLQNTSLWTQHAVPRPLADYTGHLWSLAVEEQFYLVWPLLVGLIRNRRSLMILAGILALTALFYRVFLVTHGAPVGVTYKFTFCRMDSLLIGAWLSLALRGQHVNRILKAGAPVFWITAGVLLLTAIYLGGLDWQESRIVNVLGYSMLAVASAGLIAMSLNPGSISGRLFRTAWLCKVGTYAYGLYVWHMLLSTLLTVRLRDFLGQHLHSKALAILLTALLLSAMTFAVAIVSYQFYEKPFLKLKKYFDYDTTKQSGKPADSIVEQVLVAGNATSGGSEIQ